MNLLMLSGDRTLAAGEKGPFHWMLEEFSDYWSRIDIVCPRVERATNLYPLQNVTVHPCPGGRMHQRAHARSVAADLAATTGLDLVVSHDYGLFRHGSAALQIHSELGLPWISEIHHVDGYPVAATLRARLQRGLTRLYVRRVGPAVTAFRADARQIADLLERWGVPRDKIALLGSIYLDPAMLSPTDVERDIDLLFCGRLEPEKGLWLFLESLKRLVREHPEIRVVVVGRGSLAGRFARAVERSGLSAQVERISWVSDTASMTEIYRRSRVLACTSFSEGNPRVVAEAMACGVTVVSTPVGRVPELIEDYETGRVADWDAIAIADAVGELLRDRELRERIAERAPGAVESLDRSTAIRELASGFQALAAAR